MSNLVPEMRLTVIWHKVFWPSANSPTGFATHGGLARQIEALSNLFDATRVVGPCSRMGNRPGDRALMGTDLSIVSLTSLPGSPLLTWLVLPFWFVRNGATLTREISGADAVAPLLPSPLGTLALLLALAMRKCIRLYPRTLLTRKTRNLLLTWMVLHFLPFPMWRPTVIGLLRWYGRWLMLTDRGVRALTRSRSLEASTSIATVITRDPISRTAGPDLSV